MKRVLLLILLSVSLAVMAQDSALVRLNRQLSLFPQEKTHPHTRRPPLQPPRRRSEIIVDNLQKLTLYL